MVLLDETVTTRIQRKVVRSVNTRIETAGRTRSGVLLALALGAALAALVAVGVGPAEAAFPGENGKIAFSSDRTTG
jgi:hypothetical protein